MKERHLDSSLNMPAVNKMNQNEKFAMVEKHIISPELMKSDKPCGVIYKDDETISIMLNEEDHIRIQAISPGDNIEEAFDTADKIDNLIEESVEFAFSEKYGYLTSCPTKCRNRIKGFIYDAPSRT